VFCFVDVVIGSDGGQTVTKLPFIVLQELSPECGRGDALQRGMVDGRIYTEDPLDDQMRGIIGVVCPFEDVAI
jgi:hypothetical protein